MFLNLFDIFLISSSGRALKREPVYFSSSPANEIIGEELKIHDDHFVMNQPNTINTQLRDNLSAQEEELVFFRSVVFSPEVPIRLDYHGKSVKTDQVCRL